VITKLYIILAILFLAGGLSIWRINLRSTPIKARENTLKFFSYFVIINILFIGIVFHNTVFRVLCFVIILGSLWEFIRIERSEQKPEKPKKLLFWFVFLLIVYSFIAFSAQPQPILFLSFFTVTVFDAFSQVFGQLFGKRKMLPAISPGKTWAGFAGGFVISILVGLLCGNILEISPVISLMYTAGTALFAFAGDTGASFVKRSFGVKDFSKILPGQGGFLDRFDSLMGASVYINLIALIIPFNG